MFSVSTCSVVDLAAFLAAVYLSDVSSKCVSVNTWLAVLLDIGFGPSAVTFNAGGAYPNSELGNLKVPVLASSVNFFQVQDMSRFEAKDGSISIDFDSTFTGNIYAVAKSTAINA